MKHKLLLLFFIISIQLFSQNKNQTIGFKENKGQIVDQKGKPNTDVKYLLNSNGLNVQLKKNGFSYDVYEVKKTAIVRSVTSKTLPYQIPEKDKETKPEYNLEYIFHRIDIDFVNCHSKVELITEEKSSDFDNYYNVPNKPEGITNVYQYKQITYKNIYPNIDVVFSIPNDPQKVVEYNFVIHPKGKISDIQLKFDGAETDLVDNKIQMNVRFGKMEETLPASWVEDGSSKKEIAVGYRKIKKNVYGFDSSDDVFDKTLIIDPVPIRLWGTYYAGNNSEFSTDICNDINNNVYFSGYTWSTTNIATSGSYIEYYMAHFYGNGFVAKFDTNGVRLWGIYYAAVPTAIKIDTNENLYFTGSVDAGSDTDNSMIATPGSHQAESKGYYTNAYLVKLNSSGTRQWSTFYGGDYLNIGYDIALDAQNNVYLVGMTMSSTNIASTNAHQLTHADDYYGDDGFIAKFTPQGVRVWGTYYGGERDERILSANISDDGFLYVTGRTSSTVGISTTNNLVGVVSGMISKFNLDGQQIWGRYFNGSTFSLIDKSTIKGQFLYFIGTTNDHNNLNSTNTFNESFIDLPMNFGTSSYIAKFDVSTQNLVWGTYFGEIIQDIAVNSKNKIIIEGCTSLQSGIATPGTYSTTPQYGDAYMIKLDENGQREWGTYYGGNANEGINGAADVNNKISLDRLNNIYLVGNTQSTLGISTPGAHQENYSLNSVGGLYNVYLAKFQDCLSNPTVTSNSPVCIGKTLELKASGGTNYLWTGPNGFTSTDQNPTIINAKTVNSGEYSCLITGTGGCDDTKKINVVIGDIEKPIPDLATLPTITGDCKTTIITIPTATDVCAGAITGSTTNPLSYNLPGTYIIIWNYDDGNGNISHQNQTITITSEPIATANTPQTFCILQNATFNDVSITGQNIKWYTAQTAGTILPNVTILQNGTTYYASQTINGCESERIPVSINIQNTLSPTGNTNQPFCSAQNPTIASLQVTGDLIKWYDAASNGNLLLTTTSLINGKTYYASETVNGCESPRFGVTVSIVNTPSAPTGNANQPFCKSQKATLDNIAITTGQNIKWYDTNFSAAALPNTTLLEDNKTYYASQTVGCEGDRTPILVRVYNTALPTGSTSKQFCIDENATLASIGISGTNIKWYDASSNGNILPQTTLLQTGLYYATQTLNNCESERLAVTIKIQDTQIPIADSPQKFCIQKKASINNIDITGQNIKWFESLSSTINISENTFLENGKTYYASQTINTCESDRIPVTVNILEATSRDCINLVDELPYQKFFTPNNDGYNDTWTIDFAYLAPNTGIRIFDRYGKFIKELNFNGAWDGTYIGRNEPAADYWFTVTRLNGTEFRGHFSLKR